MPSTASLAASNHSKPSYKREAPTLTLRRLTLQPLTNLSAFVAALRRDEKRLAEYLARGRKGSIRLDRAILDELDPTAALYLYANNIEARIAFAGVAKRHIAKLTERHRGTIFWVTFIPKQFVVPEGAAADFDPRKVHGWAHQALRGLSYVGMVEPAYYTNVRILLGGHEKAVSWHAHLLLWGADYDAVQRIMKALNRRFAAFLPGVVPAYAVAVSKDEVIGKLLYMLKAPQSNYRVWPMKTQVVHPQTAEITKQATGYFRQKKGELRPCEMARMCRVLADKYLDWLAFAGGDGKDVLAAIRKEALLPLRRQKARHPPRGATTAARRMANPKPYRCVPEGRQ